MLFIDYINKCLNNKTFEKAWRRQGVELNKIPNSIIFYQGRHGKCEVEKFLDNIKEKIARTNILRQIVDLYNGHGKFYYKGFGIQEIKTERGNFLYFIFGPLMVITNVYVKKERVALNRSRKRMNKYIKSWYK